MDFFQNGPPEEPQKGRPCQQVSERERAHFGFCGCLDYVDPTQTFPAYTLVGVAPAF